jgi:hypothetical protein
MCSSRKSEVEFIHQWALLQKAWREEVMPPPSQTRICESRRSFKPRYPLLREVFGTKGRKDHKEMMVVEGK